MNMNMINPNAEGLAYSAEDFEKLKDGAVLILHYNLYNKGTFVWVHENTHRTSDGLRAIGRFAYTGDSLSTAGDYLYEHDGAMCRGSGAEPVCREMPEDHDDCYNPEGDHDEELAWR